MGLSGTILSSQLPSHWAQSVSGSQRASKLLQTYQLSQGQVTWGSYPRHLLRAGDWCRDKGNCEVQESRCRSEAGDMLD